MALLYSFLDRLKPINEVPNCFKVEAAQPTIYLPTVITQPSAGVKGVPATYVTLNNFVHN